MANFFFLRSTAQEYSISMLNLSRVFFAGYILCIILNNTSLISLFKQNLSPTSQVFLQSISPYDADQNSFAEGTVTFSRRLLMNLFEHLFLIISFPPRSKVLLSGSVVKTVDPLISCTTLLGMASKTTEYSFGVIGNLQPVG